MEGWISLHRKMMEHWIWKDANYLKAWIAIIMIVNHEDKKILIENELIDCNRGQSLNSLASWANIFGNNWSIQKVRTFFDLLKKDSMINTEGLRKTTRLTVCNYELYQNLQQTNNRQTTDKQQADNKQITTNNKDNNVNNNKEDKSSVKTTPKIPVKNPKKESLVTAVLNAFCEEHGSYEILNFGKEARQIKIIIGKYKDKYPDATDDSIVTELRSYFTKCVNIDDPWLKTNMSPSLIVSKFNEINKRIKNGKEVKKTNGATTLDLAEVIGKHFATDYEEYKSLHPENTESVPIPLKRLL